MFSTFHGIEIGKKGIMANRAGMDNVGHNLDNVANPAHSRQRVNLQTFVPIYDPSASRVETPGQIGTGVVVESIQRIRDQAIDDRINFEKGGLGFWDAKKQFLHQIEMIYNEPGDSNLRTAMDAYWESWQKVTADPAERASRVELIERSKSLTNLINHNFRSLYDLRSNANALVEQRIGTINHLASEIAHLNSQIVKSEAVGDNPNDLYDRRDDLIDRLAKIVDIRVERTNRFEAVIFLGSENLVQGGKFNPIYGVGNAANDGFVDVRWADGRLVRLGNGELAGLISARDDDIKSAIDNLNSLSTNLIDSTNEIHRDGFGLNGTTNNNFFKEVPLSPFANADYDFNNDGVPDGTAIFRVSGTERLSPDTLIGSDGVLDFGANTPGGAAIVVEYNASDTINDVINRINRSDAEVSAYLNHKGQLGFKSRFPSDARHPEFVLRHLEDSGNLLVGIAGILAQSGPDGAFDYQNLGDIDKFSVPEYNIAFAPKRNPGGWIAVDDIILANPDNIAAAGGTDTTGDGKPDRISGYGDNRNALRIAELRHKKVMIESQSTFGEYFKAMVGNVGTRSESAEVNMNKNNAVVESLVNLRKQISGVNVDEELTKMLMYQHAYNASARVVSTFDRMLEVLMRMGA
jgi:flagellar hook-associated protein 1 FlgK